MRSVEDSSVKPVPFHLGYRPALDGIRCFAVLWVIGFHYNLPFGRAGLLGVDVFFTLSGFLITILLVEEWKRSKQILLGRFYLRRVLRLYPALLLMLLCFGPIAPLPYIYSTLTYSTNWIMALHLQPVGGLLDHVWSLSVEEQYYLLWPISLVLLLRSRLSPKKIVIFIIFLACASTLARILTWNIGHDWYRVYMGTDLRADGLLLGSAFGLSTVAGILPNRDRLKRTLPLVTLLALLLTVWMLVDQSQTAAFVPNYGILGASLITIIFISRLVVYPSALLVKFFSWTPLVKIGMISYGLYLWHAPIGILLDKSSLSLNPLSMAGIKIVLTFLAAGLSYRFLEKPILRLKSRFEANPVSGRISL